MLILTPRGEIKFEARENTSDELVVKESFIENVYQVSEENFEDTGIAIDLGANIGAFSLFATTVGAKKVYAYEPVASNFKLLVKNIRNNELLKTVKAVKKAVGAEQAIVSMIDKQGNSHISGQFKKGTEQAEMIRLEDVFTENEIAYCDVLKIDVEGSEYPIICGASIDVLKKIKYITMEFHSTTPQEFGVMISWLSQVFNIHIIGSYDKGGQIYAKRY